MQYNCSHYGATIAATLNGYRWTISHCTLDGAPLYCCRRHMMCWCCNLFYCVPPLVLLLPPPVNSVWCYTWAVGAPSNNKMQTISSNDKWSNIHIAKKNLYETTFNIFRFKKKLCIINRFTKNIYFVTNTIYFCLFLFSKNIWNL